MTGRAALARRRSVASASTSRDGLHVGPIRARTTATMAADTIGQGAAATIADKVIVAVIRQVRAGYGVW